MGSKRVEAMAKNKEIQSVWQMGRNDNQTALVMVRGAEWELAGHGSREDGSKGIGVIQRAPQ